MIAIDTIHFTYILAGSTLKEKEYLNEVLEEVDRWTKTH